MLYLHFNFNIKKQKQNICMFSILIQYQQLSEAGQQNPSSDTTCFFENSCNDSTVSSTYTYYVHMMTYMMNRSLIDTIGVKIIILTVRTRTADANDCCHKRFFFFYYILTNCRKQRPTYDITIRPIICYREQRVVRMQIVRLQI